MLLSNTQIYQFPYANCAIFTSNNSPKFRLDGKTPEGVIFHVIIIKVIPVTCLRSGRNTIKGLEIYVNILCKKWLKNKTRTSSNFWLSILWRYHVSQRLIVVCTFITECSCILINEFCNVACFLSCRSWNTETELDLRQAYFSHPKSILGVSDKNKRVNSITLLRGNC